jgi:hypothetical protein
MAILVGFEPTITTELQCSAVLCNRPHDVLRSPFGDLRFLFPGSRAPVIRRGLRDG